MLKILASENTLAYFDTAFREKFNDCATSGINHKHTVIVYDDRK
jgi:hypothetical protein